MTRIFQIRKLSLRALRWLRPKVTEPACGWQRFCTQICWFDLLCSFSSAILRSHTLSARAVLVAPTEQKVHAQLWWGRLSARRWPSLWGLDPWTVNIKHEHHPQGDQGAPGSPRAPLSLAKEMISLADLCHTLNSKSDVPQNTDMPFKHKMQLVSLMKRKSMDYERSKFSVLSLVKITDHLIPWRLYFVVCSKLIRKQTIPFSICCISTQFDF